jgi:hypothetical protein
VASTQISSFLSSLVMVSNVVSTSAITSAGTSLGTSNSAVLSSATSVSSVVSTNLSLDAQRLDAAVHDPIDARQPGAQHSTLLSVANSISIAQSAALSGTQSLSTLMSSVTSLATLLSTAQSNATTGSTSAQVSTENSIWLLTSSSLSTVTVGISTVMSRDHFGLDGGFVGHQHRNGRLDRRFDRAQPDP